MPAPDIVADVKRRGVWITAAAVVAVVIAIGIWGALQAKEFESLARAAKADAATAMKHLQAERPAEALASFQLARDEFSQARDLLGPEWLRSIPWLGHQLGAAGDLATIGMEASSGGAAASEVLTQADEISGEDGLGRLLQVAGPHLEAALQSLVVVAERSQDLSTDWLVPQLAEAVGELQEQLEPVQPLLDRSQSLLDLQRYLFTAEHRFLVLNQNSAQLRPTGGFPGTYGLVEFGPDGFHLADFADIYTLPDDTLNLPIPDGGQVNYDHFYLRNANAWLDFPTSAEVMLQLWRSMPQQPDIDGIVAIDMPTLRDLLKVFGPIRVPESDEPLTAANVMEQLSYVVEIEKSGGLGEERKKTAVVSMAKAVVERITHPEAGELLPTLTSLAKSADQKHIQLYFADRDAQAAIVAAGWSGAIGLADDITDLVAVSNSVIRRPAKGNLGVDKSLDYEVTLATDGSADTTLRLGYRKSSSNVLAELQDRLGNYLRVHRGPETVLTGADDAETVADATGLPTYGRDFWLDSGKSIDVLMRHRVPRAARPAPVEPTPGAAAGSEHPADSRRYRLLLVKQADLVDTEATVTLAVPAGWRVTGASSWLRVSGEELPTEVSETQVRLAASLTQDIILDVTLASP